MFHWPTHIVHDLQGPSVGLTRADMIEPSFLFQRLEILRDLLWGDSGRNSRLRCDIDTFVAEDLLSFFQLFSPEVESGVSICNSCLESTWTWMKLALIGLTRMRRRIQE